MHLSRRRFLQISGATVASTSLLGYLGTTEWAASESASQIANADPAYHLLNRITWGVRPDELAHANAIGATAYLEEQLNPETIDDSATDTLLQNMPILFMDRGQLYSLLGEPPGRIQRALVIGAVLRATYSKRQLLERMVDFWSDHFNVPANGESQTTVEVVPFQNDAIRTHALGNFQDLVLATAKSPAMLYYLDNFVNIAAEPNENYARELMELHTLGVDGGYTEQDVAEVARAFTGWTVHPLTPSGFSFNMAIHDREAKVVLGHNLPAHRGIEDGLQVIHILCNHPSTAQFLSRKLCVRFVSDNPPQSLVDSTAQVWRQTGGEIKPVLRHIFTSAEFQAAAGQKLRRPLEFFVGALRATGTRLFFDEEYFGILSRLGQIPYGWNPPNGYPDVADAWIGADALLARWNVSMMLTDGAYSMGEGMQTELHTRIGKPQTVGELVDAVATQVFGTPLPPEANTEFIWYATDGGHPTDPVNQVLLARKLASIYGLMLASPHFQWR